MKSLLLLIALMPAVAFAQQATAFKPTFASIPLGCASVMTKMKDFMQREVGDRIGRTIIDVSQVNPLPNDSHTLNCILNVTWKNGDVTQGTATILDRGDHNVIFSWTPQPFFPYPKQP